MCISTPLSDVNTASNYLKQKAQLSQGEGEEGGREKGKEGRREGRRAREDK